MIEIDDMTIQLHSMDRFKRNYKLYYGKFPIINPHSADSFYIEGIPERISVRTISQMAIFYAWRMKRKIHHTQELNDDDFNQFQYWVDNKFISRKCIGVLLGVSSATFCINYREILNVKKAYIYTVKHKLNIDTKMFTWEGETLNSSGWAKKLEMTRGAFKIRRYKHGYCYLLFLTKKEYKNIPMHIKNQYVNSNKPPEKKKAGTEEYKLLSNEKQTLNTDKITYESSLRVITALIEDSKVNLKNGDLTEKCEYFFNTSQKFLMNKNGQLEYYLEAVNNLNLKSVLKELYNFATVGYIKEQSEKVKLATIKRNEENKMNSIRLKKILKRKELAESIL